MEVQGSFFLIFDTRAFEQLRRRQTREFSFSVLELLVSVCVCVCVCVYITTISTLTLPVLVREVGKNQIEERTKMTSTPK